MSKANTGPRVETSTFEPGPAGADWRKLARLFAIGLAVGLGASLAASSLL